MPRYCQQGASRGIRLAASFAAAAHADPEARYAASTTAFTAKTSPIKTMTRMITLCAGHMAFQHRHTRLDRAEARCSSSSYNSGPSLTRMPLFDPEPQDPASGSHEKRFPWPCT